MDFRQIGTLGTPIFIATKNQLPEPDGSYKGIFFKTTYDPSSEEDYPKGTILTVVESGDGTFSWGKFLVLEKLTNGITDASQLQKDVEAFDGEGNKIIGSSNEHEKIISMIGETATEYELQSNDFDGLEYIISHKFENNFGLKKVIIPEGISIIGDFAFHNCVNLEEVYIPSTVISIGESAFDSCYSLKKIIFAENSILKGIGDNCFYETAISTIELPESLEEIGAGAFSYCKLLESVFIPYNVKKCGIGVFSQCDNIKKIEFDTNSTIQSIPSKFSYWCSNLTEVSLPSSVQSIGREAFSQNAHLKYIGELSSVKVIDESAFHSCHFIQNDFLRNNNCLVEIGRNAFYNMSFLTSITLPETLESIGNSAFYNCVKLVEVCNKSSLTLTTGSSDNGYVAYYAKNIYTPETGESKITTDSNGFVTYVDGNSIILIDYQGDNESLIIPEGITEIGKWALHNTSMNGQERGLSFVSVVIPDTIVNIGENAFSSTDIKSLTLGANLISIGSNAFYNCSSLFTIYNKSTLGLIAGSTDYGRIAYYAKSIIDLTTTTVNELNGLSIINDGTGEVVVDYHGSNTTVDIPDGIYKIGDGAFAFSNIAEVRLSKDTTEISKYAFYFCNNLKYITTPSQNNVSSIGEYSFYSCRSMKRTCLDETSIIRTIGSRAFYNCLSLTSIILPETLESIGDRGFYSCENLVEIYNKSSLVLTASSGNGYVAYYAKNIYTPEEGESKIAIDSNGFVTYTDGDNVILVGYEEDSESLIIPEGVTEIGNYVFYYNQATSIIFPQSISKIGKYAFAFSKIENISFQEGILLENIGEYAFRHCNVKSVKLPKSIELIGTGAFEEDSYLERVEFEDGILISEINHYTFDTCPKLLSLEVPVGVTTIGRRAFYNGVRNLILPNSINSVEDDFFSSTGSRGRYINFLGTFSEYINSGVSAKLCVINGKSKVIGIIDGTVQHIGPLADNLLNDLLYVNCEGADNLTEIADYTFDGASSLLSVSFKESTPLTSIGSYSFNNCPKLLEIIIPSSVANIGDCAFRGCDSLRKVTFGENSIITEIGYSTFSGCGSLSEIILPNGITTIGEQSFASSGLTCLEIPNSVTTIESYAFEDTKITELVIPENVSTIGSQIIRGNWSTYIKNVVMEPTTPPAAEYEPFGDPSYLDKITVKPGCGEIYKTATNWDIYADKIVEATE